MINSLQFIMCPPGRNNHWISYMDTI